MEMVARSLALRVLSSLLLLRLFVLPISEAAKKKPPAQPVNINTATSEELQLVPGIGPATAQKILQMRKSYGPFKSVDDLLAIRGLGPKRLEKMRKYLVAGKPNSKNASPAAGCSGCAKPKTPPAKSPVKTSTQPATSQTAGGNEEPPL
jgi:competence ComEA-like helix-hairpin-helix protein